MVTPTELLKCADKVEKRQNVGMKEVRDPIFYEQHRDEIKSTKQDTRLQQKVRNLIQ